NEGDRCVPPGRRTAAFGDRQARFETAARRLAIGTGSVVGTSTSYLGARDLRSRRGLGDARAGHASGALQLRSKARLCIRPSKKRLANEKRSYPSLYSAYCYVFSAICHKQPARGQLLPTRRRQPRAVSSSDAECSAGD